MTRRLQSQDRSVSRTGFRRLGLSPDPTAVPRTSTSTVVDARSEACMVSRVSASSRCMAGTVLVRLGLRVASPCCLRRSQGGSCRFASASSWSIAGWQDSEPSSAFETGTFLRRTAILRFNAYTMAHSPGKYHQNRCTLWVSTPRLAPHIPSAGDRSCAQPQLRTPAVKSPLLMPDRRIPSARGLLTHETARLEINDAAAEQPNRKWPTSANHL
jgi:hypothetical protein